MKICFAASSGGHFEQLMMLKPLMEKYESFVVTEKTGYEVKTPVKCYYLQQVNRRQWRCLFYLLKNTVDSLRLLHKEQPDVVVCTGVLAMIPLCMEAKLSGRKLIYIESFAKVTSATLTGKLSVTNKTIINRLAVLVKNGFVVPILVNQRIRSYELSKFTRDNEEEIMKAIL